MKYVTFGNTGFQVSAVGFGCAPMGSRFGKRESLRALEAAFDSGVTVFDTARSYGYGDSERILGSFLRGKRDRVVVSSKFGIKAAKTSPAKRLLKTVARQVFRLLPRMRQAAAGTLGAQFTRGGFSVAELQESVELSLSELGTDHLDVLFLHSCSAAVLEDDELFGKLDGLVREGKVRCYGVASGAAVITASLRKRRAQIGAAQFSQSLLEQGEAAAVVAEPASTSIGKMAHQPFGGGSGLSRMRLLLDQMRRSGNLPPSLRQRLAAMDDRSLADLAINGALHGTGVDVVICSMFTVEHVRINAAVAGESRYSDEDLGAIQRYFRAHSAEPSA